MTLKIGISGIRGIIGDSLTDEVVSNFAKAFAAFIGKGNIIIGRDSRSSGEKIENIITERLKDHGINVVTAKICPTPTVQLLVKKLKADGGIVITASHNPSEWNGIKFINNKGLFLNNEQNHKLIEIYSSRKFKTNKKKGKASNLNDPDKYHIETILKHIDPGRIKKKEYKVVLDSCNGAGSIITQKLLKEFGCQVIPLYTDPNKEFPRGTEPVAENLTDLSNKVRTEKADIGFAQDPDADRLSIVTDNGEAIGEEYSLVLSALHIISKSNLSRIATNLSTSTMIDDIAKKFNARVIRTKVGEINVVEAMLKRRCIIGGEGNGGVIYPNIVCSRDSLTGIALILDLMAERNKKISDIVKEIPKYHMIKSKINCSSKEEVNALLNKIKEKYKNEEINYLDGIKVIFKDSWLHVRPSNTEPVVRVIAEARSKEKADQLIKSI